MGFPNIYIAIVVLGLLFCSIHYFNTLLILLKLESFMVFVLVIQQLLLNYFLTFYTSSRR